jgi:hypothetical protein
MKIAGEEIRSLNKAAEEKKVQNKVVQQRSTDPDADTNSNRLKKFPEG